MIRPSVKPRSRPLIVQPELPPYAVAPSAAPNLYRAAQTRALDQFAIQTLGLPGYVLMCRAAQAAFAALRRRWPRAGKLAVVCGGGNNGGDGYVLARLARAAGLAVEVSALAAPGAQQHDARRARDDAEAAGVAVASGLRLDDDVEVIVDALFGTGLNRAPDGVYADAIDKINSHPAAVLALDLPSGLHADSGRALGAAVRADLTASFIAFNAGLFSGAGAAHCGAVELYDLGLTPLLAAAAVEPVARLSAEVGDQVATRLGRRPRDAHKGDCGHVLVVGGDLGMGGAARLAAEAAARVGAGLVSVATRPEHAALYGAQRPELMFRGVASAERLGELIETRRVSVIAIGPGLGTDDWGRRLFAKTRQTDLPLVIDADALNLLAETPEPGGARQILTPHPGEAGRLLGQTAAEIQRDRFRAADALVERYGGSVVLKGSGSLIAAAGRVTRVCTAGNPGMASGGMGDVLSGVIAGLLAQRLTPFDAAELGVTLHGAAADRAAAAGGERGLLAGDLFAPLRRLVNP